MSSVHKLNYPTRVTRWHEDRSFKCTEWHSQNTYSFFCRLLYWTDVGTDRIERASMDGTSRTVLHSTGLSTVYGLTLDYENQVLYWADYSNNRIERSFTNGSNRVLVTSTGIIDPFGITFYNGKLYWTDWSRNAIYTLTLSTPSTVSRIISVGGDPYGIHVVTQERQPEGELWL